MKSKAGDVITYVPEQTDYDENSGRLRRGVRFYTHQLGMNFTLVLLLALFFQFGVAVFIGFAGVANVPMLANMAQEPLPQLLRFVAALVGAALVQVLIVAEMAQVVWLRHPDRLKVRLMSGSVWWWIMLTALIVTTAIDLFLFFLAVTGQRNFDRAWNYARQDQLTGGTIALLFLLNMLTLLRCASVMRTSSAAEIKAEVEERLKAQAEEILIDAGDQARAKAHKLLSKLSINPEKLVPLHDRIFQMITDQHPDLLPPDITPENKAYDFGTNTVVTLPPELYLAFMRSRHKAMSGGHPFRDDDQNHLWSQSPDALFTMMENQFENFGRPGIVDASEAENPRFVSRPAPVQVVEPVPTNTAQQQTTALAMSAGMFLESLALPDKIRFATYLTTVVYPHVHGGMFPVLPNATVFDAFDEVELQWYYRYWKKHQVTSAH